MLKLILIGLVLVWFCEAAISGLQLVIPDDSFSALTGGKSSSTNLGNSIPSLSNAISDEDKSSKALSEESSNESIANSSVGFASSQPSPAAAASSAPSSAAGPAPAALTRVKPSSALSSITSTSGLSRGSLLISSSAQATAISSSPSSSPVASVRSSTSIQHRILPAETIPLPITISTRPGLRTVIAPETITIQQPGIAKVGEVVQQIPTAVSHQRQTVVHNHARVVTPIVAPAVRTVTSQIVRAYHTPLVYAPHVVEN